MLGNYVISFAKTVIAIFIYLIIYFVSFTLQYLKVSSLIQRMLILNSTARQDTPP